VIELDLPLRTARLLIDRMTRADGPELAAYRNDPETARYQGWSLPCTIEAAEAVAVSGQLALRGRGGLAGDAMIAPFGGSNHEVELGITLAPGWRGQGLAAEAVEALVDACFRAGKVKVSVFVDVRNERSQRLFEGLGFRREGLIHYSFRARDGLVDEVLFSMAADLWRRPKHDQVVEVDPHPADVALLEGKLYEFNVAAVGVGDGAELAAFERDELGRIVGGVAGVVWAGGAELRQLWVREDLRRGGLGRRLVRAFEDAVRARGARKSFVSTHSFQAPEFYQRLGYAVTGSWEGWPAGHRQWFLERDL
jgi:RimJ/RimL family protein N-acetyltransferase